MTTMNLSELSWNDLRAEAKRLGINARMKRADLEAAILAHGTPQDDPAEETHEETPEEKRARLLQELAELGGNTASTGENYGPNYWAMPNNDLKRMCLAAGILRGASTRDQQIAQLQQKDFTERGMSPRPRNQQVEVVGTVSQTANVVSTNKNSAGEPTQHCLFLMDQDGNKVVTVHGQGKLVNGERARLPMAENAARIMELFNGGNA